MAGPSSEASSAVPNLDQGRPAEQFRKPRPGSDSFTKIDHDLYLMEKNSCKYIIVDIELLNEQLKSFAVCKICGKGEICFTEDASRRMGCAANMTANCNNPKCTASKSFMSSDKTVNGQFDINLRFIYAQINR